MFCNITKKIMNIAENAPFLKMVFSQKARIWIIPKHSQTIWFKEEII